MAFTKFAATIAFPSGDRGPVDIPAVPLAPTRWKRKQPTKAPGLCQGIAEVSIVTFVLFCRLVAHRRPRFELRNSLESVGTLTASVKRGGQVRRSGFQREGCTDLREAIAPGKHHVDGQPESEALARARSMIDGHLGDT